MRQRGGITPRLTGWFSLQRLEAFTEMLEATMGDPGGIARNTFDCACARSQKQRPSSCHEPLIPQLLIDDQRLRRMPQQRAGRGRTAHLRT